MKINLTLSHSSSVAITVSIDKDNNGSEPNGLLGTIALINMLTALGKDVTVVVVPESFLYMNRMIETLVQSGKCM